MKLTPNIIMATRRATDLAGFRKGLESSGKFTVFSAQTNEETLDKIKLLMPALVVIDSLMEKNRVMALIQNIIETNAFIHTAVLTDMPEAEFHEVFEGMGVLAHFSLSADKDDAEKLLSLLQ